MHTKEELNGLTSNFANNTCMNYVENNADLWNGGIVDFKKCICYRRGLFA